MNVRPLPLLFSLVLLGVGAAWWLHRVTPSAGPAPAPVSAAPAPPRALSDLGVAPDWSSLEAFQGAIGRSDFLTLMDEIFTVSPAWRKWFEVSGSDVKIFTNPDKTEFFILKFAPGNLSKPVHPGWRGVADLPATTAEQPLAGMKIAIDPGHIGGPWGRIEERWFQMPGGQPVMEGEMTLQVAQLLKPQLEKLGAAVTLVRDKTEPVTEIRPEMLQAEAAASTAGGDIKKLAERLFYRTAEIRARARIVNEIIQPDLVLCLHFNADDWGNAQAPVLAAGHHFHLILNGGYTDDEIALADQRQELVRKLVQGIHGEETAIAETAAATFVEKTGLPPYHYDALAHNARNVAANPYLWARNLLANRLYDRPVVYFEPYVMNCQEDYTRIQAGDYEGVREVAGKLRPSIFREYADAVAEGLARFYRQHRATR
jgi:N-acetylmuramoyl-L-alanine amidase